MDSFIWTKMRMPNVYRFSKRLECASKTLLISLPLTWETLCLVDAVKHAFGKVIVIPLTSGPNSSLEPGVFKYLDAWDVIHFTEASRDSRDAALSYKPDYLIDCIFTVTEHSINNRTLPEHTFIIEDTRTGGIRLRHYEQQGLFGNPYIILDDYTFKKDYENLVGIGYSVIASIMSLGILLVDKHVTIVGYGPVGKGIARFAGSLGANILISDINPSRQDEARRNGFDVEELEIALPQTDMLITATGQMNVVNSAMFELLRENALLVNAGADFGEWDQTYLHQNGIVTKLHKQLDRYTLPNGKSVIEVAGGNSVNLVCGISVSEFLDMTFSLAVFSISRYGHSVGLNGEFKLSDEDIIELDQIVKTRGDLL